MLFFLRKWTLNVSKFILFHKWTAIFKLDINFQFFYKFICFWNVFADISKRQNVQTCKTVTNVTQKKKKKSCMTMKSGIDVKYT